MTYRWECINAYGAVVYSGLFQNEAELIARQHGLHARPSLSQQIAAELREAEAWYAEQVKLMSDRAPA